MKLGAQKAKRVARYLFRLKRYHLPGGGQFQNDANMLVIAMMKILILSFCLVFQILGFSSFLFLPTLEVIIARPVRIAW